MCFAKFGVENESLTLCSFSVLSLFSYCLNSWFGSIIINAYNMSSCYSRDITFRPLLNQVRTTLFKEKKAKESSESSTTTFVRPLLQSFPLLQFMQDTEPLLWLQYVFHEHSKMSSSKNIKINYILHIRYPFILPNFKEICVNVCQGSLIAMHNLCINICTCKFSNTRMFDG